MKKSLLIICIISTILQANSNYTTVKNGKVINIPDYIKFDGTIKSIITIENYKLAKMIDEEGNIIRGRFNKNDNLFVNDKFKINCFRYNGIEYLDCKKVTY